MIGLYDLHRLFGTREVAVRRALVLRSVALASRRIRDP